MTKNQMTRVDKIDYAARWAERRAETAAGVTRARNAPRSRPEDRWAVSVLLRGGDITAGQFAASKRLIAIVERSREGAAGSMVRVDRSRGDPHAQMYDRVLCGMAAESAFRAMEFYPGDYANALPRNRIVRACFDFPTPSLSALNRLYSDGHTRNTRRITEILRVAVASLERHWGDFDAGRWQPRVRGA